MRTVCERMRAVQGQPVSGQREEEKGKSHEGYRFSSSGYSRAVSSLFKEKTPSTRCHGMDGGCGGDFTADPLGAVGPSVSILKSSPRLVGQSRTNPETFLRGAVQVSS